MSKRIIYKQIGLYEMLKILYEATISEEPVEVPTFCLKDGSTYDEISTVDLIREIILTEAGAYSYFKWELEDSSLYIEEIGEEDD